MGIDVTTLDSLSEDAIGEILQSWTGFCACTESLLASDDGSNGVSISGDVEIRFASFFRVLCSNSLTSLVLDHFLHALEERFKQAAVLKAWKDFDASVSAGVLQNDKVSGTVRNCCFEADNYIDNLLSVSEFLLPVLLLPVAGKKAYNEQDTSKMPPELKNPLSHEREPVEDPELRIQALDSIYLVILQEAGRKAFWCVNGPRILEVGYADEEDPGVMEAYERVGSLLVT